MEGLPGPLPHNEGQMGATRQQVQQYDHMHVPGVLQQRQVRQSFVQGTDHDDIADELVGRNVCIPVGVCPAQKTPGRVSAMALTACMMP